MTPEQVTDLLRELAVEQHEREISELKRQVAVAEYERNLILDDIAKKDAEIAELRLRMTVQFKSSGDEISDRVTENALQAERIAELERENVRLSARVTQAENQAQLFYGREFDAVMESQRLSAALNVARQGTPLARFAELYCGHDPLSGKQAELAVMERIAELERENERLNDK